MRSTDFSRRNLAMVALTLAPLAFMSFVAFSLRVCLGAGPRSTYWSYMSLIYLGFLGSLRAGLYFRRPLVDPKPQQGIFGGRQRPRPRLWMLLVTIALGAPMFAFWAQERRESYRQYRAFQALMREFDAERIAHFTKMEREILAAALKSEQIAAEYRAKDARGEPRKGERNWADMAKSYEGQAAVWRGRATVNSNLRKQVEQSNRSR
jgi:hypothetical protein